MNLENLNLVELDAQEVKTLEGGGLIELCIAGSVICMWAFDKGVEYGRSLARN
ncbi:MAG TPA: hypothetical protein VF677_09815 [Flavobacterium sp.]|jgi:hypothetical protein